MIYKILIAIFILSVMWIIRRYIIYFIIMLKRTIIKKMEIEKLKENKKNVRKLNSQTIKEYIKISKDNLEKINYIHKGNFILNKELEMHLKYSKFSEKYIKELGNEILKHIGINNSIEIEAINCSSRKELEYSGIYFNDKKKIIIYIKNNRDINTVISIMAHECTHYLMYSNNINLPEREKNEYLTDITVLLLGFQKYILEGYKIYNTIQYEYNKEGDLITSVHKNKVGYLNYADVKYAIKKLKRLKWNK